MSQSKTFLWCKCFKDGRTSVDNSEHSGQPSTSTAPENITKVREAILADHRQTIHDVSEIVGLSYRTIQRILADNLNMRCISVRFVPRLLSDDQKTLHIFVCRELKQQTRDDPETKQQSLQWKSPNSLWLKKETSYSNRTRVLFNILPTKLNTLLNPLL